MSERVQFGGMLPVESVDFETLKSFCLESEKLGLDFFMVSDHLMNPYNPRWRGPIECWTTLAGLAAVTNKIKLGPIVSCYGFRHPTILAKMTTTVDIISNGRLIFGIGAGWHEGEFKAFMGRFPSSRERLRGLEETIEICKSMFTNEWTTYHGKLYNVENVINSPQPVQKSIPIMIGGGGEKRTLRIAAKYGDISNFLSRGSVEEDVRKFSVLRRHCEAVGRNYDEIVKSTGFPIAIGQSEELALSNAKKAAMEMGIAPEMIEYWIPRCTTYGPPENFVETFREYIRNGITHFTCGFLNLDDLRLFSEKVIPELKEKFNR
jgi:alkanesulfonate monooxygenase SsuD/methylene tetrahydromethanopterin reductase-like flavin-dependent oxidoreductase (luciferase family)